MFHFALKMLMGDRSKFIGILFGLTFSSFIITQQSGIFIGLMQRTFGFITDTSQPDIWVMDPKVQHIDDFKPMKLTTISRIQGIEGVKWAVPLYRGVLKARLSNGNYQNCNLIGIDDSSLIGGPPIITEGNIRDLRYPDAVIVNEVGAKRRLETITPEGKKIPLKVGDVFEINDRRAKVVGFCRVQRTFRSEPVVYTTLSRALTYAPAERNLLSFILVKAQEGESVEALRARIHGITGLAVYTNDQFKRVTVNYYVTQTGILINFGFAVFLGFVIGAVISGQTFYNFALDNIRLFAAIKAMGGTNETLVKMVLTQAGLVGILGWAYGVGLASLFGLITRGTELSFKLPWELFLASGMAILIMTLAAAYLSLWKIVRLEPAIVFQS